MAHALITGSARRIGADVARFLAAAGFDVTVHYNSSRDAAETLADSIGPRCQIAGGDLGDPKAVDAVFDAAVAHHGPVDLLINNASTFRPDDIHGMSDGVVDGHMAVNLRAPLALSARMAAQAPAGDRLIVNMLDNKLSALTPDFFSYTLSKAALATATETMSRRFDGCPRVCGIAPSVTLISGAQSEENFRKSARANPLGRRVSPDDIVRTVAFLWSERAMNGQIITLDGGQSFLSLPRDAAYLVKEGKLG